MPDWNALVRARLSAAGLASHDSDGIIEELSQHLEAQYAELLGAGASEGDACRLALDELEDEERLRELARSVRPLPASAPVPGEPARHRYLADLLGDLRYAGRTFRRSPAVTAIAVLTLAIGIGANSAIFTVVNAVLLRPLPYRDPGQITVVYERTAEFARQSVAYPNFRDWQASARSFSAMAAYRGADVILTGKGQPERLVGQHVSASLFDVLGSRPALGRPFTPEEDREGGPGVVILSNALWRRLYDADPAVLGATIVLNARRFTVVGVAPATPGLFDEAEVFLPIEQMDVSYLHDRASHPGIQVLARRKAGVGLGAAQEELGAVATRLAREFPQTNAGHGVRLRSLKESMVAGIRPTLWVLLGAVGFLLVIACANTANLMLARATGRQRELAIRAALGAERGRVMRQLLTESLLSSGVAAAVGLLLADAGLRVMLTAAPSALPRATEIGLDGTVLLFTLAVSVITGLLTGLVPALRSATVNPSEPLKEGGRTGGTTPRRTEAAFVALQVGLAAVLLLGAALTLRTVVGLLHVNPGFSIDNLLTARVALSHEAVTTPATIRQSYQEILDRLSSVPGVTAAAIASQLPLGDSDSEIPYWVGAGPQPSKDRLKSAMFFIATPDYRRVLQIPLRRGRFLAPEDRLETKRVIVVDEVLAATMFPGQDPIGKTISLMVVGPAEIVGVVGHVKAWGLDVDDTAPVRDQIYFALNQVPDEFMGQGVSGLFVTARTAADPTPLVASFRRSVAGRFDNQPAYDVRTMDQMVTRGLAERRFTMLLLLVFAGSALVLAAVGVYGVVSYAVGRRTHELGVRAALGASSLRLAEMVVRQGLLPASVGVVGGVMTGWALSGLMSSLVYGVTATDPLSFAAVASLLLVVALAACLVPAWRASRVNPVTALRHE